MGKLITPDIQRCKDVAEGVVVKLFKITRKDINTDSRKDKYAQPRFVVFYILHKRYKLKYALIGQLYGRHWSSVKYGIERAVFLGLIKDVQL